MDANQRSEVNNQTNNNANEKWQPGAKGKTTEGPADHTYPQGATQQQGQQQGGQMGTRQSGMGAGQGGEDARDDAGRSGVPGGSMQTQQSGGTGPTQGITDSHQRAMEQRSGAYGQLEQPVGGRPDDHGVDLRNRQRSTEPATGRMNPQDPRQPELQGGSPGGHPGNRQSATGGGGQHGPQSDMRQDQHGSMNSQSAVTQGTQGGGQMGQGGSMQGARHSTDRQGSQTDARQYDTGGVHQSNDVAGGLPRSPGNSGPWPDRSGNQTGAQNVADLNNPEGGVHESNDMTGGLPRSPGGANKLRADENMDDDTGFSNRRR